MPRFVDRVVIHARAGSGGNGCASVHREKFKPLGGPDGGNGGRGGSIVLVVDPQVHTLLDFHFRPHVDAPSGKQGMGNNRDGAAGDDLEVKVPDGTVVLDENGRLLADLVGAGTRFEAAAGGRGGLGNAALASRARKAPGFALLGEKGQARDLTLELKTVADVGLVGFPVGGQVLAGVGDLGGQAEDRRLPVHHAGAQPGRGLGRRAHVHRRRRARPDPRRVRGPRSGAGLPAPHRAVRGAGARRRLRHRRPGPRPDLRHRRAGSRAGRLHARRCRAIRRWATSPSGHARWCSTRSTCPTPANSPTSSATRSPSVGWPVFVVSTVDPGRLAAVDLWAVGHGRGYHAAQPVPVPRRPVIRPVPVDESGFTVTPDGEGGFVVRGRRPERWIGQTDFTNDEAVGYLGDRLARLGVEDELLQAGRQARVRGDHRRHDVRLGAADAGGHRRHDVRPRHRPAAGTATTGSAPTSARPRASSDGATRRHERDSRRASRSHPHGTQCRRQDRHHRADHPVRGVRRRQAGRAGRRDRGADEGGLRCRHRVLGRHRRGHRTARIVQAPHDLATKQAAASVGQVALVNAWSAAFARYERTVGQVLLTAHDISMRVQHTNAQRTLDRLRALHAVAIVNENDTVATNEIRFGDNDRLSALVAHLVGADALVLLSDIDGLYDADPRKATESRPASSPRWPARRPRRRDRRGGQSLGHRRDGLEAVLGPAGRRRRVPVLLAAAADAAAALTDASVGTVFAPRSERMSARRFWVRYAAEATGALTLDEGAVRGRGRAAPFAVARRHHRGVRPISRR